MARKRKRNDQSLEDQPSAGKRARFKIAKRRSQHGDCQQTLQQFYPHVSSLRQYILLKLPNKAKSRRRKVERAGLTVPFASKPSQHPDGSSRADVDATASQSLRVPMLASLLDNTVVCASDISCTRDEKDVVQDFQAFTQRNGSTAQSSFGEATVSLSDIVDFSIWTLFHRNYRSIAKPQHLLCQGFQRAHASYSANREHCAMGNIPGLILHYPNNNVNQLKSAIWEDLFSLMGMAGERLMLDLLTSHNIFLPVSSDKNNLNQICGIPMSDLQPLVQFKPVLNTASPKSVVNKPALYALSDITFMRSRALYARPALNAKGHVTLGLRHIHALRRFSDPSNLHQTVHLMKYMFPRQFHLHNVFTSKVDPRETAQKFKDYTLREEEILAQEQKLKGKTPHAVKIEDRLPRRLRGHVLSLVQQLQKRSRRCSVSLLLLHHCSAFLDLDSTKQTTSSQKALRAASLPRMGDVSAPVDSVIDLATSSAHVSAFCRSVISCLVPDRLWGIGSAGQQNKSQIMRQVDGFVKLRRFEILSLHAVLQNIKICAMAWLSPRNEIEEKTSESDIRKRREIFSEFVYYVFDSIVIPLLRSNFHVTESNAHQNKLFYFRHDVWRALTEPSIASLKSSIYEAMDPAKAKRLLDSRQLGFSHVRLLPKASGFRPIMNLRRRTSKLHKGRSTLGRSVNSIMTPAFHVLDLERNKQPERLEDALFSVGDIYPRVQKFKSSIANQSKSMPALFLAKIDVKACFDTIPQRAVIRLIEKIVREKKYRIERFAEVTNEKQHYYRRTDRRTDRPQKKFLAAARAGNDFSDFNKLIERNRPQTRDTVLVDAVVQQNQPADKVLDLIEEHVANNIVKIGKNFFRQKAGIPQGSVLSSLLCSFFYAKLQQEHLPFLKSTGSLLLRLIDDFLLITTCRAQAEQFLQAMHNGFKDFGVEVNVAKSLANFEVEVNGEVVPRLGEGECFPYCGTLINPKTLEITKDRNRRKATVVTNTLTVDASKRPGQNFYRRMLHSFKIQTMKMFMDTNLNSRSTVLGTIYQNLLESAMKVYRYWKCMPGGSRPDLGLMIGTIRDLIGLAYALLKGKQASPRAPEYNCSVTRQEVAWLASKAFRHVLSRKQTGHRKVIQWLDGAILAAKVNTEKQISRLEQVVQQGDEVFSGYRY